MKTTDNLTSILKKAYPEEAGTVLTENEELFVSADRPFAEFLRGKLKEKGLSQQNVFLAADIPEGYGYKLVSEQKHTRRRDVILRLCFAAHLTLDEMQRALKLCGLQPLYARQQRDAVLMIAANREVYEIQSVNDLLTQHGMDPLVPCGTSEE